MPAAVPTVNGVAGSNGDLPIDTLVQLGNTGSGGELTYVWSILDQPTGAADSLSATNIVNPTITPKKEGSYLLLLIVNLGLASEKRAQVVLGIRELRSNMRVPAAGETTEVDSTDGWAAEIDTAARDAANLKYAGTLVGATDAVMSAGQVVYVSGRTVLKSGLPGEEKVPTFSKALASSAASMRRPLYVLESGVKGVFTSGAIVRARRIGRYGPLALAGVTVGDPIYVSDTATIAKVAGTNERIIGRCSYTDGANIELDILSDPGGAGAFGAAGGVLGYTSSAYPNPTGLAPIAGAIPILAGVDVTIAIDDGAASTDGDDLTLQAASGGDAAGAVNAGAGGNFRGNAGHGGDASAAASAANGASAKLYGGDGGSAAGTGEFPGNGGDAAMYAGTGGEAGTAASGGAGGGAGQFAGAGGAGSASQAAGAGGNLVLEAGGAGADNGGGGAAGGGVDVNGGAATGPLAVGGPVDLQAGQGGATSTATSAGAGGTAQLKGGLGGDGSATGNSGAGGAATVQGGDGGTDFGGGGAPGGAAYLNGGAGTGGFDGGTAAVTAGVGGGPGASGGTALLVAGTGGAASGASAAGNGGGTTVAAGSGGAGSATGTAGAGLHLNLNAGDAGANNGGGGNSGGDVYIKPGTGSGSGADGAARVQGRGGAEAGASAQTIAAVTDQIASQHRGVVRLTSGANYVLNTGPMIFAGLFDGEELLIINEGANTITLQGTAVVGASILRIGNASSRALGPNGGNISLRWNAAVACWIETGYSGTPT